MEWIHNHPRSECCELHADDIVAEYEFHAIVEGFLCKWCNHRHGAVVGSPCEHCLGEVIDGKFNFQWDGNQGKSDSNANWFRQVTEE